MTLKIVKILVVFGVILWIANLIFSPGQTVTVSTAKGPLFSKDLSKRVNKGQLVIVDTNESDRYIQEDLATHDLLKAMTFARYKSEVLERPLFIENAHTLGNKRSVAKVDPTDRQAWQHLTLLEIDLKRDYERKHPKDIEGYKDEKAMDSSKVPDAMQKFINEYPDSFVVSTALAHIEYSLCTDQKDYSRAIAVYDKLENKNPKSEVLKELLPIYKKRAEDMRENSKKSKAA